MPYVSIGIKNKSVGTVSNKDGFYNLKLNENISNNDTVVFSYSGFLSKTYLVSEIITRNQIIKLAPKIFELNEVVVTNKKIKLKPQKIGRNDKGLGLMHFNFYTSYEKDVDDRLSKEIGMKLKINSSCHIKDLKFNITSNDFKVLKFRVNIYKIENDLPTELLIKDNIILEINDNTLGWFTVDLQPYDIYIKKDTEEVAVTIQWLESVKANEKSKYFSISTASSPFHTFYFREKAMDSWKKGTQNLSFYINALCE